MSQHSPSKNWRFFPIVLGIAILQLGYLFPESAIAARTLSKPITTIAQNLPDRSIPFETLDRGSYAGIREPFEQAIVDAQSWEAFWNQLHGDLIPIPPVPEIDFTQKTIVAVGMGERNSGGYGIEIESATIEAGTLGIYYRETTNTCGVVTMALTQPYHVAIVDRLDFPVRFF